MAGVSGSLTARPDSSSQKLNKIVPWQDPFFLQTYSSHAASTGIIGMACNSGTTSCTAEEPMTSAGFPHKSETPSHYCAVQHLESILHHSKLWECCGIRSFHPASKSFFYWGGWGKHDNNNVLPQFTLSLNLKWWGTRRNNRLACLVREVERMIEGKCMLQLRSSLN